MSLVQRRYRYTEPNTVYQAIDDEGNVYIGITGHMARRAQAHGRNGRRIIESHESDHACLEEVRTMRFYQAQVEDGEAFRLLNKAEVMPDRELEKRWPENHKPVIRHSFSRHGFGQ